jgi:uncharacterized protein DUF4388
LSQELEHLAAVLSSLELRLAGSLEPETGELLTRLAGAGQHLRGALHALAGGAAEPPPSLAEHLQGSSRSVPIQDLLCFLATAKKSGVLRVEAEHERFLLQLQDGAVVYATGDAPPPGEALSELLAARGVLSTELLGRLPDRAADGAWVDRNLLGTSWIARESLAGAIQQQTRLSFFRLCAARDTRFRFYEGAEIQNVVPVRQSAMELLLEYSRALDESGEILAARARDAEQPLYAREGLSARPRRT